MTERYECFYAPCPLTHLPVFLKEAFFCICLFQVIGVAQIINKKSGEHQFTQKDEEVWLLLLL